MLGKGVVETTKVEYVVGRVFNKNCIQITVESCNVARAPFFIALGIYSAENVLEASIQVTVTMVDPDSGFCASGVGDTAALTAAIAGAFGPVGAGIAALFGVISASCSLASSGH